MKRFFALALVFAMVGLGVPTASVAAQGQSGQVAGAVKDSIGNPAANYSVRLRNAGTGGVAGTATTGVAGDFSFSGLGQGTYVVEILDANGRILATSTSISLTTGAMTISGVAVTLSQKDALAAAAAGGGGSFFTSTVGILAMAGAAGLAVGGIVVAKDKDKDKDKDPKSPSK